MSNDYSQCTNWIQSVPNVLINAYPERGRHPNHAPEIMAYAMVNPKELKLHDAFLVFRLPANIDWDGYNWFGAVLAYDPSLPNGFHMRIVFDAPEEENPEAGEINIYYENATEDFATPLGLDGTRIVNRDVWDLYVEREDGSTSGDYRLVAYDPGYSW
ncbi:virion structural protein [Pseudomonas phage PhiPA3]|uniref:Uncharacterized protein 184 n=1 Tax=Pseudomonas phage PhiPA3 TaxID=998086 RepID=F8SK54_BPPA3|nr:virion structural protein [Pseudomonas phage PhiPA3]AEH03607.1 hypothetical protein [Pseudomonas phage PhiPA3]